MLMTGKTIGFAPRGMDYAEIEPYLCSRRGKGGGSGKGGEKVGIADETQAMAEKAFEAIWWGLSERKVWWT